MEGACFTFLTKPMKRLSVTCWLKNKEGRVVEDHTNNANCTVISNIALCLSAIANFSQHRDTGYKTLMK